MNMTESRIVKVAEALWADERGAAAIEYALLAALIFGAIVVSVGVLGDDVFGIYEGIAKKVSEAVS